MKRLLAIFVLLSLVLSACASETVDVSNSSSQPEIVAEISDVSNASDISDNSDTVSDDEEKGNSVIYSVYAPLYSFYHFPKEAQTELAEIDLWLAEQLQNARNATESEIEAHRKDQSMVSSYIPDSITFSIAPNTPDTKFESITKCSYVYSVYPDNYIYCFNGNTDEEHYYVFNEDVFSQLKQKLQTIYDSYQMPYTFSMEVRENLETELSVYYNVSDFKGLEIYVRPEGEELKFVLLPGTNRLKTKEEVDEYPGATLGEMREILKSYSLFSDIVLLSLHDVDIEKFGEEIRNNLFVRTAICNVQVGFAETQLNLTGENANDLYIAVRDAFNMAEDASGLDAVIDRTLVAYDTLIITIAAEDNQDDVYGIFYIQSSSYADIAQPYKDAGSPTYYKLPDKSYEKMKEIIGNEKVDELIKESQMAMFEENG